MEKKEYFNILLRRDFIRYVLLRKPRLSSEEVSQRLKSQLAVDRLNRRMKQTITPTLDKYLSLQKLKDKRGDFVNKLPDWLNPALVDDIVQDFQGQIAKECDSASLIQLLFAQIERLTWLQGVDEMAADLRKFAADIKNLSEDYAGIPAQSPEEYDIQKTYKAAKTITVSECVLSNNNDDVAEFRGVLMAYAQSACETAIHRQLARLFADISNSEALAGIIAKFSKIAEEARAEYTGIQIPEHPAEWDAEYNRLVPIDFFERNIEEIDAAMAFHMLLLQAFARNEAALLQNGILSSDGKITLFTKPHLSISKILTSIITTY